MFAILGDIEFTVAGGISGLEQSGTADWAEHARIQGKPLLEWIGEGLDTCNLTMALHPMLGDPEERLRALRQAKSKHEPLAFVMGSGEYLGAYVITDISNALRRATAVGQIAAATVQVTLKEYTGVFNRKILRPGLLDPALNGTPAAAMGSPGLISKLTPPASPTQLAIGHAKTVGNVLRASKNLYDSVKSGSPSMILGQVPQLLSITARAIEPLQGFKDAAGLLDDGADLSRLSDNVMGSVMGSRSSLDPVDIGNIVDRFASSRESLGQAATTLSSAGTRLAGLAAQVFDPEGLMFITHVTTEGERWDQLAWRYYGDAHRYLPIVEANAHVPITAALPAGLTLAIPMLEPVTSTEDLPPWMR